MIGPALLLALQLSASTGVEGRVTAGEPAAPVEGAWVQVDGSSASDTTGADGAFRLVPLEPGRWTVRAGADGMEPRVFVIRIPDGSVVRLDVHLERANDARTLLLRVVDARTGAGLPAADVTGPDGRIGSSDRLGRVRMAPPTAAVRLTVRAFGYAPLDTLIQAGSTEGADLHLSPRPIDLAPLTLRARAGAGGLEVERALFTREPLPGVVGLSGDDLRDLPFLVERDVLRSLQSLPGVVQINDLSARLHVRGGAPDQNRVLLDDAPVLGPYHLFGMFGVLDPSTVRRVEFYRAFMPARYGGATSSVLEVQQRTDAYGDAPDIDAGIGFLSARGLARGSVLDGRLAWMVAGRRTVTDVALERLGLVARAAPFSFHDVQTRLEATPTPHDRLRVSAYTSEDDFTMFLDGSSADVRSAWRNRVASARWDRTLGESWEVTALLRHSGYSAAMTVGGAEESPKTANQVSLQAASAELRRRGRATGLRVGLEVEAQESSVDGGDGPGGYVEGRSATRRLVGSAWAELEHWLGPVRLTPGLRVTVDDGKREGVLAAPRLAARLAVGEEAFLTFGFGRSHQRLSTLRDDRYPLPGAPIWFLRDAEAPTTAADQVSVSYDGWYADAWSVETSVWARRFQAVPSWRPEGVREASLVSWHDGDAWGGEVMVRRHTGSIHGWVSYGFGSVTLEGEGGDYHPAWDRRHSVDLAGFWRTGERWTVSTRVTYGTGTPFWPQTGEARALWIDPGTGDVNHREPFPIWSDRQSRYPEYFRADVGIRGRFHLGDLSIEPHASVVNLTGRQNVLFYEYRWDAPSGVGGQPPQARLEPFGQIAFTLLPILGFDVSF